MGKRIMSTLLSVVVAAGLCPTAALAAQGAEKAFVAPEGPMLATQSAAIDESEPNDDFNSANKIKMNQYVYGGDGQR